VPRSQRTPLDDQLCFTIYSTNIAINRTYKPMLDAMGITYPQYLVLSVLGTADGASVSAIADRLGLEPSTITPLLKRLEQGGLVARRRSRTDERQVEVSLTKAGHALLVRSNCLNERLLMNSGMTRKQILELNQQIKSLREVLDSKLGRPYTSRSASPDRER
jgi:MarR family transcriptional regulator, organic hydroperoxide resistance regulator